MIIPFETGQLVKLISLKSVHSFYVTKSPLSVNNIADLASFNDYPFGDRTVSPTDLFEFSLVSLYVTESPLSVGHSTTGKS